MIKKILLTLTIVAFAGAGIAIAQQSSIKRTPLQKLDFPAGYNTVTALASRPGVSRLATLLIRPAPRMTRRFPATSRGNSSELMWSATKPLASPEPRIGTNWPRDR